MRQRTVAVVQARMGSQRLPEKMLAPLGGRPVLEWVLRRTARARLIDEVVLATSVHERDDRLVELAHALGIRVFRGSETDVLGRVLGAGEACGAEWVVRVCADNPLIDPGEIDRLVRFFEESGADYACNHLQRRGNRYADGFGAEIITAAALRDIARKTADAADREHVTLHVWRHEADYNIAVVPAPAELAYPHLKFDVDTAEDLAAMRRLLDRGCDIDSAACDIVRIALREPAAT